LTARGKSPPKKGGWRIAAGKRIELYSDSYIALTVVGSIYQVWPAGRDRVIQGWRVEKLDRERELWKKEEVTDTEE
jgi:hypothetical protein